MHELVHQAIFTAYDCDSHIGVDWKGMYTEATDDCVWNEEMIKLHLQNEIVGYAIHPLILALYVFSMFIVSKED
jgi:hypothetical protein